MHTTSPPASAPSVWLGRLFGAIAMLGMLAAITLGRGISGSVSLLDALADAFLLALPVSVFSWFLEVFGQQAKTLFLAGLALALVVLGAWLGGRFLRRVQKAPGTLWASASTLAIGLFAASAVFVLIFVNAQSPELLGTSGFMATATVLAIAAIAYGLILGGLTAMWQRGGTELERPDRRSALAWGAAALAGAIGLAVVGREVARVAGRKSTAMGARGTLSTAITPIGEFYTISKNFLDPTNDRGPDWSVTIDGLVDNELTLSRADLEAMNPITFISTQLCISNDVGGGLIGTAEWTGIPLASLFEQAGVGEGAFKVVFEGTDGYTTGVPMERVLQPESHLVWAMNGQPLPREHGEPVRAVVPGLYGMKSVKWLTTMTVTDDDYQGYWETRNWTDDATVKTMSRIDTPLNNDVVSPGAVQVGGVAFAGDRGVGAVEISTDGGETWQSADIREEPNPDGVAWVIWTWDWPARQGAYDLVVRAIEDDGTVQTADTASPLPDGSSGWHRITVGVT